MAISFSDSVSEVAGRLRMDTSQAAQLALVEGWVNESIQDIHSRYDWFWTIDRKIVQTVVDKDDGTVSVSSGGTTVSGSSTLFADTDVGRFIQFAGDNDWYKITSVSGLTSLEIEKAYTQTSDLSAATYIIRTIFYTIEDAEKILDVVQAQTRRKLDCISYRRYDADLPFSDSTGKGERYFVYGCDTSGNIRFTIHPHADAAYNLEIRYKKKATEDSFTLIPDKWRSVYSDGALSRGLEYVALGQTDFDRNQIRMKRMDYEDGIKRMLAEAEPESDYSPRLQSTEAPMRLRGPHLPDGLSIPLD